MDRKRKWRMMNEGERYEREKKIVPFLKNLFISLVIFPPIWWVFIYIRAFRNSSMRFMHNWAEMQPSHGREHGIVLRENLSQYIYLIGTFFTLLYLPAYALPHHMSHAAKKQVQRRLLPENKYAVLG